VNTDDEFDARVRAIWREERRRTLQMISDVEPEIAEDLRTLVLALNSTIDSFIANSDRIMEPRVIPVAAGVVHEELLRLADRVEREIFGQDDDGDAES
jgi:hypothetical protein